MPVGVQLYRQSPHERRVVRVVEDLDDGESLQKQ